MDRERLRLLEQAFKMEKINRTEADAIRASVEVLEQEISKFRKENDV